MKKIYLLFGVIIIAALLFTKYTTNKNSKDKECKILFLHHSTGNVIFQGKEDTVTGIKTDIPLWLKKYNDEKGVAYSITEQAFPKSKPYGWRNYPFDYYNIWVKNASNEAFMEEPTLEILTKQYDLIIFKHCFPVSYVVEDSNPDIESDVKSIENYKLQYQALKEKILQFPESKFLVWTGAALVEAHTTVENAIRAKDFFEWVKNDWGKKDDNIFIWDFFELETEGGLYLKPEYAVSPNDSHPNKDFAKSVVPMFGQRIVDVIENDGMKTTLTGISK